MHAGQHIKFHITILIVLFLALLLYPQRTSGGMHTYSDEVYYGYYTYRYLDEVINAPIVNEMVVVEGDFEEYGPGKSMVISDGYGTILVKMDNFKTALTLIGKGILGYFTRGRLGEYISGMMQEGIEIDTPEKVKDIE